ncbi:testis-specific serine/threonine-protein kinase 6 [Hoplias malabaricus]|uniref:testis-specific serine/threonine-protein kinase 6 n=1 Tax=Hoplias malabaricus TaxID=27720 RepID=UPI003461D29D
MADEHTLNKLGYELGATIGEGSYSKVKLAISSKHSKQVAIKIIDRNNSPHQVVSKFLPREMDILRVVKHAHIIHVYEVIEASNGPVYIVMEAASMDLLDKIKELNCIPSEQARTWFSQILSAVDFLHQKDIVHRDLKCENVLLTAEHKVKLTDLGFACFSKGHPELRTTYCGSAAYAAPEVLRGVPYDAKKSDVWSLGVILYVMVAGGMPFDDTDVSKLPQLQRGVLVYPAAITMEEPCRALISYMLQYNPSSRPSVSDVAQQPWLQQQRQEP